VQSPSWASDWLAASQEIPRISRNPKVHYRTHKRTPPVPILGQLDPDFCAILSWKHSPPENRMGEYFTSGLFCLQSKHLTCECFLTMFFLEGGVVSTSPNPQAGGPPLVGCPRLLIQFIRSYPPYRRPFLYPQPEDEPWRGDRDPLTQEERRVVKVTQNGKTIIMVQYIHTLSTLRIALREERLMWKIWQSRTSHCSSDVGEQ